jgi:hypothetical protein
MKLIKDLKNCNGYRKEYRIKPTIRFCIDKEDYYFAFLPTILWQPWVYRYPNCDGIINIWWLHFHILIGKWEHLSCNECKHCHKCIDSKKRKSYFDDVFENGEKCSEYESRF